MHDKKCELGLSRNDLFVGGKWIEPKPACYCLERVGLHVPSCDEYHAHKVPKCCSDICWCRPGQNKFLPITQRDQSRVF